MQAAELPAMRAARSSVLAFLLASLPSSRAACLPSTLAAQASSTCAVRYAGEVECWGDAAEWAGLSAWTAALGATSQISLGAAHGAYGKSGAYGVPTIAGGSYADGSLRVRFNATRLHNGDGCTSGRVHHGGRLPAPGSPRARQLAAPPAHGAV